MNKLSGRDMVYKLAIAKKVNEIIELLKQKGIIEEEQTEDELNLLKKEKVS